VPVAQFSLGQPSLDEVFLALTGHPAESAGTDDEAAADRDAARGAA
jgi:ABC-2 type transport system ATP-binding protein